MQKHWKAIQWFSICFMITIVVALVEGWMYFVYGFALSTIVFVFVYLIGTARFDGRRSDEENEKREREQASRLKYQGGPTHGGVGHRGRGPTISRGM